MSVRARRERAAKFGLSFAACMRIVHGHDDAHRHRPL